MPKVEVLPIEQGATPDENNVNKHTAKGGSLLVNSLQKRGAFRSIASAGKDAETPVVYAGNYTLEKAVEAGFTEIVNVHVTGNQLVNVVRDDVAPGSPEAIALGLEDNESAKQSYNPDIDLLASLAAGDNAILSALRKEDKTFSGMLEGMGLKDETIDAEAQIGGGEALEKWKVKTGDLWQIGSHKILCGDSTKRADIERLTEGRKYCVLTDPPYNVAFEYNDMDDKMSEQEYADFCEVWFEVLSDAVCIIFSPGPKNTRLYPVPRDTGFWLKRNASAGASAFNLRTIEPLLIYGDIGKKRNFDLFDYSSGFPDELRAARCAALVEDAHPPAKPIGLWIDLLDMLPEGLPVVDCFSGNGTTFIACQNNGRVCYGNERDPAYCALILERMHTAFPDLEIKRIQ